MTDKIKLKQYSLQNQILLDALIKITALYLMKSTIKTDLEKKIFEIAQTAIDSASRL